MTEVYGHFSQPPALRFSRVNPAAVHTNPKKGLRLYGPYNSGSLAMDKVRCGVIYPAGYETLKNILIQGLLKGIQVFPGFQKTFRIPIEFTLIREYKKLENALDKISRENLDLVICLIPTSADNSSYQLSKKWLLGNGIPSQIVTVPKLQDERQRPWVIENVALASYAKIGGAPWVVASDSTNNEVIIGVSRAIDRNEGVAVGFVTLFSGDGDFLYMGSKAPVISWPKRGNKEDEEKYVVQMEALITEALNYYTEVQGPPDSVVLHLCKKPGPLETSAVKKATANWDIPYAIIHINDDTTFRLFDTADPTYVPRAGLVVMLNSRTALLLLDGRSNGERKRRGVPRLIEVRMDTRSSMPESAFPRLVKQVVNLARMNWRGFNAKASPASLNYSHLIAKLVVTVGFKNWNELITKGQLREKAWFL